MPVRAGTIALAGVLAAISACGGGSSANSVPATMTVRSAVLRDGQPIRPPYACTDENHLGVSPPLSWTAGPKHTEAYAVTIVDTDAGSFLHWGLLNVPARITSLPARAAPPAGTTQARNDYGKDGYGGPCPPPGRTHHYVITVWAMRHRVSSVDDVRGAASARATMTVTYHR